MLNDLSKRIREIAVAHGFWDTERNFGEMIALAHSELSEALEEHRAVDPCASYIKDGKPEGYAIELIDCIIRCLDTIGPDVDIDMLMEQKMKYNENRPYKHGKNY